MSEKIMIRPAKKADAERIVELWHGLIDTPCHVSTKVALKPGADIVWRKYFISTIEKQTHYWRVAVLDGRIVGYTHAYEKKTAPIFKNKKELEVSDLFVDFSARGHGLGGKLLEEAFAWGRMRGLKRASLTARVNNIPGIKTYEKAGMLKERFVMVKDL